jgi:hypothetical protein
LHNARQFDCDTSEIHHLLSSWLTKSPYQVFANMSAPQAVVWPPEVASSLQVLLLDPTMPLSKANFAQHCRRLWARRATFDDSQFQEMELAYEVIEAFFERAQLLEHHHAWLLFLQSIHGRLDGLLKDLIDADIKHEHADTMRETIKDMRDWSNEAVRMTAMQSLEIGAAPDSTEVSCDDIRRLLERLKPDINFYRRVLHDLEYMVCCHCKVVLIPDGIIKVVPIRFPWPARVLREQMQRWKNGMTVVRRSQWARGHSDTEVPSRGKP